jgi:hypothetical protein
MIRDGRAEKADHPAWAALLAKLHEDSEPPEFEKEIADWVRLREPYVPSSPKMRRAPPLA